MVVALHLVVEHLALLRGGVGDQLRLDDLEDVVADVGQLRLDLRLVVTDQGELVALLVAAGRGKRAIGGEKRSRAGKKREIREGECNIFETSGLEITHVEM